ncbi:MAG TPA: hypothetical protein VFQ65_27150 [Kofleriaceae bacterium]|nr:hypothetical protein [Kofleriaceae bacterium]
MKRLVAILVALPTLAHAQPAADEAPTPTPATAAPTPAPAPTPASPAASPAPAPEAASDADLAALGLDPTAAAFDDKLNIFGFADFSYQAWHFSHPVLAAPDTHGFAAGSLNLYVSKNLTERWRMLAEIRFLYLPNGGLDATGTTTVTTVMDPTNFERPITWGGIAIQRAYIEYDLDEHLTIRAGRILTPYGIWNTDHGSPAIIAAYRPYIIGEQYFPEQLTGIELFGKKLIGEYKVGYHATITNGRSPVDAVSDPDGRPAFGGRLEFAAPWSGTLKLGASGYMGRYTGVAPVGRTAPSYEERSYGADVQWDHGGLHVQAELIGNDHHYLANARATNSKGFAADGRQWGGYALAGYRFDHYWNVMPFAMAEYIRPIDDTLYDHSSGCAGGLNFRPSSNVILKVMYNLALSRGAGLIGDVDIHVFTSQIAWVF